MTNLGPTKEEYDSLIYKLATLEAELGQARKFLEAPAKAGWWKRFWVKGVLLSALVLCLAVAMVGVAAGKKEGFGVYDWQEINKWQKIGYVMGYYDGMLAGSVVTQESPKKVEEFFENIKGWSYGQNLAIIDKYIKVNPHDWDKPFGVLVLSAYEDACAKKGFHLRGADK